MADGNDGFVSFRLRLALSDCENVYSVRDERADDDDSGGGGADDDELMLMVVAREELMRPDV